MTHKHTHTHTQIAPQASVKGNKITYSYMLCFSYNIFYDLNTSDTNAWKIAEVPFSFFSLLVCLGLSVSLFHVGRIIIIHNHNEFLWFDMHLWICNVRGFKVWSENQLRFEAGAAIKAITKRIEKKKEQTKKWIISWNGNSNLAIRKKKKQKTINCSNSL